MVTHMVLFKFDDPQDAQEAVRRLLSMKGKVASLSDIEAGLDITRSPRSYDVGLITRHASEADLDAYRTDPVHLEVAGFIKERSSGAAAVDFRS
jgi:hypothetical protein